MQASPADQAKLLHLAEIDTALAQARHRRAALPELAQLKALGATRQQVTQDLVAATTRVSDLEADQERLESDLDPARARRERNQARVDAGEIGDAKALRSMTEELEHLRGRIATLEDQQLDLMQQIEDATSARDQVAARRHEIDDQARALMAARDRAYAEIDGEVEAETTHRTGIAGALPADVLALYEKIAARQGFGAARLTEGRCTGCHVEANAADLRRYQSAAPQDIVRCEECGRILIR